MPIDLRAPKVRPARDPLTADLGNVPFENPVAYESARNRALGNGSIVALAPGDHENRHRL